MSAAVPPPSVEPDAPPAPDREEGAPASAGAERPLAGGGLPVHPKRPVPYIVLVGLDLSEPGGRAWRFAFDLAELRGEAEIHAVVVGPRRFAPAIFDVATPDAVHATAANDALRMPPLKVLEHRSAGGRARLMAMHFRAGRPDRAIVRLAVDLNADLIVVADQPTSRLARMLGGSMSDRIARDAPCPVVVVKAKRGDGHDEEAELGAA